LGVERTIRLPVLGVPLRGHVADRSIERHEVGLSLLVSSPACSIRTPHPTSARLMHIPRRCSNGERPLDDGWLVARTKVAAFGKLCPRNCVCRPRQTNAGMSA